LKDLVVYVVVQLRTTNNQLKLEIKKQHKFLQYPNLKGKVDKHLTIQMIENVPAFRSNDRKNFPTPKKC